MMSADCHCARSETRASAAPSRPFWRRTRPRSWLGLLAAVGAALAPKCPLCLAAYLSAWGLGVGLSESLGAFAPALLPCGLVLGALAAASLARVAWRGRARR